MKEIFIRKKYRIYPNASQRPFLEQTAGCQRWLWNYFLDKNMKQHKETGKFIFYHQMATEIVELRTKHSFLAECPYNTLQSTCRNLDAALRATFRQKNKAAFPKFKSKRQCKDSFADSRPFNVDFVNKRIKAPKLKSWIRCRFDKDDAFVPRTSSIMRDNLNDWYVSFVVKVFVPDPVAVIKTAVGVDLNSDRVMYCSDGTSTKNPKFLKNHSVRLKRYQRRFARKTKGSANRIKAKLKVAKHHKYISGKRDWFLSNEIKKIVDTHDLICLEDLNVKGIQRFNGKIINDAPFGKIRSLFEHKATKAGKHVVVIDRYMPSSKMCYACGQLHNLSLNQRVLRCDCGVDIDRDWNAALNILKFGVTKMERETAIPIAETARSQVCGVSSNGDVASAASSYDSMKQKEPMSLMLV